MGEVYKCSICGLYFEGFGNNAQPINDGRCCDNCNSLVITKRMNDIILAKQEKQNKEK